MDSISVCLGELRERRARIDKAIASLVDLQTSHETKVELEPTSRQPRKKTGRKRGRPPAAAAKPNGMSAALTCMQCSPPREFTTGLGLSQHKTWRHTGRQGSQKSLIPSSLTNA